MHNYLLLLISFISVTSLCQVNGQEPVINTNSTTNSISIPASEKEEYQDTTILEIQKVESKSSSKKAKVTSDKDDRNAAPESYKQEINKESGTVKSASNTFTLTKQQAASQRTQRSPSVSQQQQMDDLVKMLEKSAPESFEFHYFKYVAGNYNVALIEHLKKAETLRPTNSDVHIQMAAYYLIINDSKNALIYLEKLVLSTRLNADVIDYAEDLLKSAPENGTLITHGMDDSYATMYVQLSKKIRSDVKWISLDFLQSEQYRESLKGEGYKLPTRTIVDVQYLQEFCINNSVKNIAISMTTPKEYLTTIQQNLFVVGLVFEYHTDLTFNNFYKNDYLWNEVLVKKLINNATNDKAKQLSSNYLPMLLHLRKVYEQTGEKVKLEKIDKELDKVAVQCKKYDQVQKLKSTY